MMKNLTKKQKAGTVLLWLVAVVLITGSFGMIFPNPTSTEAMQFAPLHAEHYIRILGVIKLLVGVGLLCKSTRYIAALVGTGYLGGAIMATITMGMPPIIAAVTLLVLWLGMELVTENFLHLSKCAHCDPKKGTCKTCTDDK